MNTEGIGNKACELCRTNFNKELKRNENRLDSHSKNLEELTKISIKLTQMQEAQKEILEQMSKRLDLVEKTLVESEIKERVDKEVAKRIAESTNINDLQSSGFWEKFSNNDAFLPIVFTGCIVILAIVIGAVGQDSTEVIKTIFGK